VVARRLASDLVKQHVAACVNILPGVKSVFRWKGQVEHAAEHLLIIKTRRSRFSAVQRAILKLHPYDVPEVIALPITAGYAPYLHWIRRSC
jgi:periplasmic divalent cation tolerance protein